MRNDPQARPYRTVIPDGDCATPPFDPGVVRFRKRRKIVLADGALDGLL
jgi:hypothetical protein